MPEGGEAATVRVVGGIGKVSAAAWDACFGDDNPFVSHAFLSALERSGSATPAAGWAPAHLTATIDGRLVGAAPLYVKSHSYGEYVFDHAWAAAFERAGGRYYPKLQVCVPFTPVPGPRLAVAPGAPRETGGLLAEALAGLAEANRFSSAHVTFADEADMAALLAAGWLERRGLQYHWFNRGYGSFDDFLAGLSSRKRKQIRRERREAAESGIIVRALTGADLTPAHWDAFHHLYMQTAERKWGGGYLTRSFFRLLGETMADKVLLVMCEDRGEWVAGALNLIGRNTLYGRNWGGDGGVPFLHFEACYYQAIDFAIARGLSRVEAGAQGEHKLQRGYEPVPTFSAHWIVDPGLRQAIADFLAVEQAGVAKAKEELAQLTPYRRDER
ncbi:MAG TPA: GNAT family N-acetyltransferase [Azospirillaceae bacterium]|nr:GNAT family N-acetyltransferase [Azospirillaceae bacterium]